MSREIIQHYRTNGENIKPLPENIEYGELSINYRDGGETLFIKNDNNKNTKWQNFNILTFCNNKVVKVISFSTLTTLTSLFAYAFL